MQHYILTLFMYTASLLCIQCARRHEVDREASQSKILSEEPKRQKVAGPSVFKDNADKIVKKSEKLGKLLKSQKKPASPNSNDPAINLLGLLSNPEQAKEALDKLFSLDDENLNAVVKHRMCALFDSPVVNDVESLNKVKLSEEVSSCLVSLESKETNKNIKKRDIALIDHIIATAKENIPSGEIGAVIASAKDYLASDLPLNEDAISRWVNEVFTEKSDKWLQANQIYFKMWSACQKSPPLNGVLALTEESKSKKSTLIGVAIFLSTFLISAAIEAKAFEHVHKNLFLNSVKHRLDTDGKFEITENTVPLHLKHYSIRLDELKAKPLAKLLKKKKLSFVKLLKAGDDMGILKLGLHATPFFVIPAILAATGTAIYSFSLADSDELHSTALDVLSAFRETIKKRLSLGKSF